MSKNQDVFQVIVSVGNAAILAADLTIEDLAVNQIGVFDADTNISIDATSTPRAFYIAMALDTDGDAAVDTLVVSAGQNIQTRNITYLDLTAYAASAPAIGLLSGYSGACDQDFLFKVELRNEQIYRTQGSNQFTLPFSFTTGCCDGCEDCPTGDANEVTQLLLAAIAADQSGWISATAVARQDITTATVEAVSTTDMDTTDPSAGDVLTANDIIALIEFNAGTTDTADHLFSDVEITTNPVAINTYYDVNLKYFGPRETTMIGSLLEGFDCNGTFTITQNPTMGHGAGYDIRQKEYEAGGWNNRPGIYRASTANGVARSGFDYKAVLATTYTQISIGAEHYSVAGFQEHLNNTATIIAYPSASTTTGNALIAVLDAMAAIANVTRT